MSLLKQPGFLKKIEKAISAIPGLEDQLFSFRKKKRSDNPLVFIDRKDEERILMNLLQRQHKDEKQAAKNRISFSEKQIITIQCSEFYILALYKENLPTER